MSNDLFNSINTNRHYNENIPKSDDISCIPLEEVETLLKKCAKELGMDYEPERIKNEENQMVKNVKEIKKWLNS